MQVLCYWYHNKDLPLYYVSQQKLSREGDSWPY